MDRDFILSFIDPDNIGNLRNKTDDELRDIFVAIFPDVDIPIRPPKSTYKDNLIGYIDIEDILPVSIENSVIEILGNPLGNHKIKRKIILTKIESKTEESVLPSHIKHDKIDKIEPKVQHKLEPKVEPKIEKIEPKIDVGLKIDVELKIDKIKPKIDKVEPKVEPKIDKPKVEPKIDKSKILITNTDRPLNLLEDVYINLKNCLKEEDYKNARIELSKIENLNHVRWLERLKFKNSDFNLKQLILMGNNESYEIMCAI